MAVAAVTTRMLAPANELVGRSKLTGGAVDVALPQITDNSLVFCQGNDGNVTGILTVTITTGVKFHIASSVGGDTGFVAWRVIINQQAT